MKKLFTSVNEQEYKLFSEKAKTLEMSEYALAKKLVTDFLRETVSDEKDILYRQIRNAKKRQQWTMLSVYFLFFYFVVSLVYILFFSR
jgi:hypothetical protein